MNNNNVRGDILQFVKFNIVGLLNTLVDMAVFALLTSLGLFYVVAQVISYGAGTANSFILNSKITFKDRQRSKEEGFIHKQLLRFIALNLFVLCISLLLMSVLIGRLGLQELLSKVLVTFVTVIINFFGSRKWVFVKPKQSLPVSGEAISGAEAERR
ncbi:Putative flippase GtrA (transmembrane translocase of bactoprenol-linked glucose) [Paenibacillus sophorae]|uniref:GtrA family protein n=1 Tax=Paenibacillus sophorae TaxID=1333845 RepID=A0A1H8S702_9BACL|nr:GtrA family protein [Paenibacillus sophorae]QWU16869.1 GtrA family protein [Paenibacillus sophorae]SEO74184.1 Putative flippase GtrA (transmembrane translocase of bactoprenol-linked glucose) [Paenibacillus sophorae]